MQFNTKPFSQHQSLILPLALSLAPSPHSLHLSLPPSFSLSHTHTLLLFFSHLLSTVSRSHPVSLHLSFLPFLSSSPSNPSEATLPLILRGMADSGAMAEKRPAERNRKWSANGTLCPHGYLHTVCVCVFVSMCVCNVCACVRVLCGCPLCVERVYVYCPFHF